jgi:hypothetical protein
VIRAAALAVAALLAATPAFAESTLAQNDAGAAASIAGSWSFTTDLYDADIAGGFCQMTGELTLRPTEDPNVFDGRLVAYESCYGSQLYEAEQSAVVVRDGDLLTITSTIDRVLPSPEFYAPDNFALNIVNSALMVGELRSADIAPVTFRRRDALVS